MQNTAETVHKGMPFNKNALIEIGFYLLSSMPNPSLPFLSHSQLVSSAMQSHRQRFPLPFGSSVFSSSASASSTATKCRTQVHLLPSNAVPFVGGSVRDTGMVWDRWWRLFRSTQWHSVWLINDNVSTDDSRFPNVDTWREIQQKNEPKKYI